MPKFSIAAQPEGSLSARREEEEWEDVSCITMTACGSRPAFEQHRMHILIIR